MTATPDPGGPVDLPRPERGPLLAGQRRVLVDALARKGGAKGERAVGMYVEALRAIERSDGPECLHVAAYELREFMNALPRVLDLPILPYDQLIAKVRSFVGVWNNASRRSTCLTAGTWDGSIDDQLRSLLEAAASFVAWVEEQVPTRRAEAESILQRLAPTEHPFPIALVKMRVDEWSDLLRYFNNHTHHNTDPDLVDFLQWVERLEVFLLEHLEPRTFEDQDDIDRLIREVEN